MSRRDEGEERPEEYPYLAQYKDCHGEWHRVTVIGEAPPSTTGAKQTRYIIQLNAEEHGVLVATDSDGREWWDGTALVVHPNFIRPPHG